MSIEKHTKPETTSEEREVLARVYDDQMRDWRAELRHANEKRAEAEARVGELDDATAAYLHAVHEAAVIQGKMDALRMLAARDGVTLE